MISVNLSFQQHSSFGHILWKAYDNIELNTGGLYERGYTHNGGDHSLVVKGAKEDVLAMIDLWIERYGVQSELTELKDYIEKVNLKRYVLKNIVL